MAGNSFYIHLSSLTDALAVGFQHYDPYSERYQVYPTKLFVTVNLCRVTGERIADREVSVLDLADLHHVIKLERAVNDVIAFFEDVTRDIEACLTG